MSVCREKSPLAIVLSAGCLRLFDGRSTGLCHFFILCRAFRATHAYGADDVVAMLNGHAALQWSEVWRQCGHREAPLVDNVLEITRRLLKERRGLGLPNRDVRAGSESAV